VTQVDRGKEIVWIKHAEEESTAKKRSFKQLQQDFFCRMAGGALSMKNVENNRATY
jgi:hypothetical protein